MNKVKLEKTKAHQRYKLADGTTVPGVTTVLGVQDKPALLQWAYQCGVDGIDYRKSRDNAADIGTIAHFLIECHLKGVEPDKADFAPADLDKAENAVIKFLSWWDSMGFEFIASEVQLVSEKYRYGGTLDILARLKGEVILIDLKTSKAIYDEYWQQLAAYQVLAVFVRCDMVKRVFICRIGKGENEGDFEAQERADLGKYWDVFTACLELYRAKKALKK